MYFYLNMHIILFKNIKNAYNFIRFEACIRKINMENLLHDTDTVTNGLPVPPHLILVRDHS